MSAQSSLVWRVFLVEDFLFRLPEFDRSRVESIDRKVNSPKTQDPQVRARFSPPLAMRADNSSERTLR